MNTSDKSKIPAKSGSAAKSKSSAAKSTKEKKSSAAPRPRWFKVCCWLGGTLIVLLMLLLALALMTFSPYRKFKVPEIGERHNKALNRLSMHVSSHLYRRDPPAEATLRLSVDDVNALLEFGRSCILNFNSKLPPPETFEMVYRKDGGFHFVIPLDAAPAWLFGGKIYAEGVFFLEKQSDKLIFDIPELRFGRVGATLPWAGMVAKNLGEKRLEQAMPPEFKAAVKEIYPDRDGTLVVVYRPKALLPLIMNATKKLFARK